jgi:putative (di)nucleoside polyphosphate hydrolase
MAEKDKPYRPCVVGVFRDATGQVLVGKRRNLDSWQFPQGGIDSGESPEEALYREILEELGNNRFRILYASSKTITYDFPVDLHSKISHKFRGQRQYWFLCEYAPNQQPNLDYASSKEFDSLRWISPLEAVTGIISWKKQAYLDGMQALGIEVPAV